MSAKNILKVKRPIKPQTPPQPLNDSAIEVLQQAALETIQQPELVVEQETILETPREESVCGSGWSFAELVNEFNER